MFLSCDPDPENLKVDSEIVSVTKNGFDPEAYSFDECRSIIRGIVANGQLDWELIDDDKLIYSAGYHTGGSFIIGYESPLMTDNIRDVMATINFDSDEWKAVKQSLVAIINSGSDRNKVKLKRNALPYIPALIYDYPTIKQLKALPHVRYVEPRGNMQVFLNSSDKTNGGAL